MQRVPRIPKIADGVDLFALPLTPAEGFVLSRIDGLASVQDLADLTGLSLDEVQRTIEKLVALRAVEWADGHVRLPRASARPAPPAAPASPRSVVVRRDPGRPDPSGGASEPPGRTTPGSEPPQRASLDGSPDTAVASAPPAAADGLSPERRQRIDEVFPKLDQLDHYQVLGVARDADAKAIRSAYFELSKVFHPDTAFRKNLGEYKAKMEAIFKRLTEAYEVLGKKKTRAEYDAYLGARRATDHAEAELAPGAQVGAVAASSRRAFASEPPPTSAGPPRAHSSPPASPRVASPAPAAPDVAPPPPAAPDLAPPPRTPPSRASSTWTEQGRQRARELLQKRLAAVSSSRPGGSGSVDSDRAAVGNSATGSATGRDRRDLVRDLTGALKSAASHTGGIDPVSRHVHEALRQETEGDLAAAAKHIRLAAAMAPDRPEIAAHQERITSALAARLADQYRAQAQYEEKHKKWSAAAVSWCKVVAGRPDDVEALIHAALALVEAKGDLRAAQRHAQRACELRPDDARARRALGRVYLAAGLHLNARRELERAATLDPRDQIVKNLLRELKG